MSGRPCNPDSDIKRLWQLLLGGTPFPQCGMPEEADKDAAVAEDERPGTPRSSNGAAPRSPARDR